MTFYCATAPPSQGTVRNELATLEQMLAQTNTNKLQLREAIRELEAVRTQLKSP
ncbi:MAG: hypothetical protein ABSF10_00705 [Verrucomicrobiota bacterium]|jgi:hypothetical protein